MRRPKTKRPRDVTRGLAAAKLAIHPRAQQGASVLLTIEHEPGQVGIAICDGGNTICMWMPVEEAIDTIVKLGGTAEWAAELRRTPPGMMPIVVSLPNDDLVRLHSPVIRVKGGAA